MSWFFVLFNREPEPMDNGLLEEAVEKNKREAEEPNPVSRSLFDSEAIRRRDEQTHMLIAEAMLRVTRGH